MSSDIAIKISNLSKSYSISHGSGSRATNLAEAFMSKIRKPFPRLENETFWALKDISLEIGRGEVVGIIGHNGAGKSTLLKILSRIIDPTNGRIELFGRVGSLLEVGTGFHPELSGRENVFLNGAILGMRRPEIRKQFDAIVDFAGVEKFLDTPVKRYSSGMYVRLAFAVAAHLNPEILIIDEVLAVGDAEFQNKCLGKMQDVAKNGKTVLFVSHNLSAVSGLCKSGLLLRNGMVEYSGEVQSCIKMYSSHRQELGASASRQISDSRIRSILKVVPNENRFDGRKPIAFQISLDECTESVTCHFSLHIFNHLRENVATVSTEHLSSGMLSNQVVNFHLEIASPILIPGCYDVDVFLYSGGIIDSWPSAARFEVSESIANERFSVSSALGCKFALSDFRLINVGSTSV